jgi:hypothetical protein
VLQPRVSVDAEVKPNDVSASRWSAFGPMPVTLQHSCATMYRGAHGEHTV